MYKIAAEFNELQRQTKLAENYISVEKWLALAVAIDVILLTTFGNLEIKRVPKKLVYDLISQKLNLLLDRTIRCLILDRMVANGFSTCRLRHFKE